MNTTNPKQMKYKTCNISNKARDGAEKWTLGSWWYGAEDEVCVDEANAFQLFILFRKNLQCGLTKSEYQEFKKLHEYFKNQEIEYLKFNKS